MKRFNNYLIISTANSRLTENLFFWLKKYTENAHSFFGQKKKAKNRQMRLFA